MARSAPEYRHVYFIQSERLGMVKIGCANDARLRLRDLRVGSPDKLSLVGVIQTDDAPGLETALHRQFASCRAHGEWFRPSRAMRRYMAECLVGPDSPIVLCTQARQPEPGSTVVHAAANEKPEALAARVAAVAEALGFAVERAA